MSTTEIAGFFIDGFKNFYNNKKFFDLTIHHKQSGQNYDAHKIILSYKSGYFQKEINENTTKLEIDFEDPDNVFPKLIQFLYEGKADITVDNVVSMKTAANFFEVPELVAAVEKFLDVHFNSTNVITILEKSVKCKDEIIVLKSIDFIAKNLSTLLNSFKQKMKIFEKKVALDMFFKLIGNEAISKTLSAGNSNFKKSVSDWIDEVSETHKIMNDKLLVAKFVNALVASDLLQGKNAIKFLTECEKLGLKKQADGCARVLAKSFHEITDSTIITDMSPTIFLALMTCDELHVKSEDQVYTLVTEYINKNTQKLTPEEIKKLYMSVRYSFVSLNLLNQLKSKPPPHIPLDHIIESFWYRINRLEGDSSVKVDDSLLPKYLRQRKNKIFVYSSDFDKNGILYFLGTNFGKENYQNPHTRGLVFVSATASPEVGKVEDTISHDPTKCNLVSKANTQVLIDFKDHKIMATKYSLRHTLSRDTEALRNWTLEASNDNITYKEILKHTNDAALTTKGATHSWDLDSSKSADFYRYWRITQFGNNSSNNTYFSLAGVEFYGLLKKNL